MRKFESIIARILLFGYLFTLTAPAFSATGLSPFGSGKVKKMCKRSYGETKGHLDTPLQLTVSTAADITNIPQIVMTLFCGSGNVHLPLPLTGELLSKLQQEPSFAVFVPSCYSILFQELDPDPPKNHFC